MISKMFSKSWLNTSVITVFLLLLSRGLRSTSIEFPHRGLFLASVEETHEDGPFDPNLQVTCIDMMGRPVPTVRYHITSGNSGPFRVDSMNGSVLIITGATVDYEQGIDFYNFTVECYDMFNRTNSDTVIVNITILPVNEYFPEINISTIAVNVSEILEIGTTILSTTPPSLHTFTAFDRDRGEHGRIHYFLSSSKPNNTFFKLNSTTGSLVLIKSLDIDSNLSLFDDNYALVSVRVTVCDRFGNDNVENCPNFVVVFRVDAVNEFNPNFSQESYYVNVSETTELGVNIIELNCTDKDIGRGSFQKISLGSDNSDVAKNSSFSLIEDNMVTLVRPLDYEQSRLHNISLTCYDNDGKNDTAYLLINVTAVNEYEPHFTQDHYQFSLNRLSKVGKEIGRVMAVDGDQEIGGIVSYYLESESSHFGVRSEGVIFLADDIFIFESSNFSFTVTSTDGEFNDTAQVNVTLVGFLNVTEIAVLATAAVILLIILICLCLLCSFYRKRLVNWIETKREEQNPVREEAEVQIPQAHTIQSMDNPHYMYVECPFQPPHVHTASESEQSDDGREMSEDADHKVQGVIEREQNLPPPVVSEIGSRPDRHDYGRSKQEEEVRYQNVHPINRRAMGKQSVMPDERVVGLFKQEDNIKRKV